MGNVFDMITGSADFVTVDFINDLDRLNNDESVTAVTWTVENTAVASYVASSSAVDADGRYGSAKFNALAEGITRVMVQATTTNPTANPYEYIYIRVYTPPSSL